MITERTLFWEWLCMHPESAIRWIAGSFVREEMDQRRSMIVQRMQGTRN